ncbi:manganese efflux pump MntP [Parablautia muri]|uniref:Putative manganese efflux pump MntP n=1 Tax=Parablautia muri TaxID=2320879 RepID=A0A9X5BGA6_9FIRM|nr:manganese efflux pump MntP family protein [Parablautia muri]NBJ93465.1 manganese efflux pump [Parablautia muri]
MEPNLLFFFNSILLGIGLAMDAFSVSLANGLHETEMKPEKMCAIAGTFALFQAFMPMFGWMCVHTIVQYLKTFEQFIPWIAFILLLFIGIKMLLEGIQNSDSELPKPGVGFFSLIVQGIATSIDALSVGFTIADYNFYMAGASALIIAAVTFLVCMTGLVIGKKFGTKLSGKATLLGGAILIVIGLEIFITGIF